MFKKTIKKSNLKEHIPDSPTKNKRSEDDTNTESHLDSEPKLKKKLKTSQFTVKYPKSFKNHVVI